MTIEIYLMLVAIYLVKLAELARGRGHLEREAVFGILSLGVFVGTLAVVLLSETTW